MANEMKMIPFDMQGRGPLSSIPSATYTSAHGLPTETLLELRGRILEDDNACRTHRRPLSTTALNTAPRTSTSRPCHQPTDRAGD